MKFKKFQLDDFARAAMTDGCILALEPGLGKSLAAFAIPIVKQSKRVLLVVPGQLHSQFRRLASTFFNIHVVPLREKSDLKKLGLDQPPFRRPGKELQTRPEFYITTYHELGYNGIGRGEVRSSVQSSANEARQDGRGTTLAEEIVKAGGVFDAVVVDEGTRLQGGFETYLARGVLLLQPAYRLILSGTPIRNRLGSLFWLAWWAAGSPKEGNLLWPYAGTAVAQKEFEESFLTQEVKPNGEDVHPKNPNPKVCNLHRLWALTSPLIIRRRKEDCGSDIVKRKFLRMTLPMGSAQEKVYRTHLQYPPTHSKTGKKLHGRTRAVVQMNILRQVALVPSSANLAKVTSKAEGLGSPKVSWTPIVPKTMAVLELVTRILSQGEQVVIGSPFKEFSIELQHLLEEAGVSSVRLDGDTPPLKRGHASEKFRDKNFSVLVVGIASMGEGNSFEQCHNIILPAWSYSYAENEQFINRIWRINSERPVFVHILSTAGTIDERLSDLYQQKSEAAQLVLDGGLFTDPDEGIDFAKILNEASGSYSKPETINELSLVEFWYDNLKPRLREAEETFRKSYPVEGWDGKAALEAVEALDLPSPTEGQVKLLQLRNKHGVHDPVDWEEVNKQTN